MKSKILIIAAFLFLISPAAFGQSGGTFEITQSVIASGGNQGAAGGDFSLDGTIGQPIAGNVLNGAPFAVTSGFWNFAPLAPTSAGVTVGGRVSTVRGSGIRNARVSLTSSSGETRAVLTGAFGFYIFRNVPSGETYIISVTTRRFVFSQPTQVRFVGEDTDDVNFIGEETLENTNPEE